MDNSWDEVSLDVSMLALRCLYFAYYFEFYRTMEKGIFQFDIQIPLHPLLPVHRCMKYFKYLSLEETECHAKFDMVEDIQSIVYFSSFFECHFLFAYICKRGLNNLDEIAEILKVVAYTGSEHNQHMTKLLWFTADFLERRSVQSILDDMCIQGRIDPEYENYSSYRSDIVREEIEVKLGYHDQILEDVRYNCATCSEEHTATRVPLDVSVSRMGCCDGATNCICYTNFLFKSFLSNTELPRCKECGIKWWHGKPTCGQLMIKWTKRKYKRLRKRNLKNMISFFC